MALVLKTVTNRKGDIKRLDVVRATGDDVAVADTLKDIAAGEYTVQTGNRVVTATVGYRTVQDINLA